MKFMTIIVIYIYSDLMFYCFYFIFVCCSFVKITFDNVDCGVVETKKGASSNLIFAIFFR